MMVDPAVAAPVVAQPSLPFPVGRARADDLNLSAADLAAVKARAAAGCSVLGRRYAGDPASGTRFDRLDNELGPAFRRVELRGQGPLHPDRPPAAAGRGRGAGLLPRAPPGPRRPEKRPCVCRSRVSPASTGSVRVRCLLGVKAESALEGVLDLLAGVLQRCPSSGRPDPRPGGRDRRGSPTASLASIGQLLGLDRHLVRYHVLLWFELRPTVREDRPWCRLTELRRTGSAVRRPGGTTARAQGSRRPRRARYTWMVELRSSRCPGSPPRRGHRRSRCRAGPPPARPGSARSAGSRGDGPQMAPMSQPDSADRSVDFQQCGNASLSSRSTPGCNPLPPKVGNVTAERRPGAVVDMPHFQCVVDDLPRADRPPERPSPGSPEAERRRCSRRSAWDAS